MSVKQNINNKWKKVKQISSEWSEEDSKLSLFIQKKIVILELILEKGMNLFW